MTRIAINRSPYARLEINECTLTLELTLENVHLIELNFCG